MGEQILAITVIAKESFNATALLEFRNYIGGESTILIADFGLIRNQIFERGFLLFALADDLSKEKLVTDSFFWKMVTTFYFEEHFNTEKKVLLSKPI